MLPTNRVSLHSFRNASLWWHICVDRSLFNFTIKRHISFHFGNQWILSVPCEYGLLTPKPEHSHLGHLAPLPPEPLSPGKRAHNVCVLVYVAVSKYLFSKFDQPTYLASLHTMGICPKQQLTSLTCSHSADTLTLLNQLQCSSWQWSV